MLRSLGTLDTSHLSHTWQWCVVPWLLTVSDDEIDKKIESFRKTINANGDEELMQLCTQLSAEISAKTSHGLEIERLKSVREEEKKTEAAERKALEDELKRVKQLLAIEQQKNMALQKE